MTFGQRRLTLFVELVNIFNRRNYVSTIGKVEPSGQARFFTSSLFPFLPSIGVALEW